MLTVESFISMAYFKVSVNLVYLLNTDSNVNYFKFKCCPCKYTGINEFKQPQKRSSILGKPQYFRSTKIIEYTVRVLTQ